MSASKIRYHLNVRAALSFAAIGLSMAFGLYILWGYQENRILQDALKQVKAFQEVADKADDRDQKSRNNDLALRHLRQFLDTRPDDLEGLDLEAKLLLEARDFLGAASVYEHLIRVEGASEPEAADERKSSPREARKPVSARVQTARRHLAEIYIAISDHTRNSWIGQRMSVNAGNSYRYHTAELHAKKLLELDENASSQPIIEDAKAHLLYGLALEGQIVPGQASRERVAFVAVQGEKENEECDLRLMSSVQDVSDIPSQGKDLVLVAAVAQVLHFRIFDGDGKKVVDTVEQKLKGQAGRIEALRKQLQKLWPPHQLDKDEEDEILNAVTSITQNEGWEVGVEDGAILEYETVLKLMDKKALERMDEKTRNEHMRDDIIAALRLAGLYQKASRKTTDVTEQLKKLIIKQADRSDDAGPDSKKSAADNEGVDKKTFVDFLNAHPVARHLADLYEGRKTTDIAKDVLDRLRDVHDSVEVRTARYSFFNSIGDRQSAIVELEQAILLDPENLVLILTAAESAMQSSVGTFEPHFWLDQVPKGCDLRLMSSVQDVSDIPSQGKDLVLVAAVAQVLHFRIFDGDGKKVVDTVEQKLKGQAGRIEALRKQLQKLWPPHQLDKDEEDEILNAVTSIVGRTLPKSSRNDPRVLTVQGMIEYTEQRFETALATWRKGLVANPTDVGLSQRLALVLLELGRDDEAAKIIAQYRRLVVSKSDPVLQFLEGIQDEHAGRFSRAIDNLESARGRLPASFQTHVHLILARCQEKQGDLVGAAKTYRAALVFDPKSLVLRQFLGRLLLATQPEEAAKEFEQGLATVPDQPALLVSLAEARLQQQRALPQGRRNWDDFDAILKRATAVLPSSIALILLKAERWMADARADQAIPFLREAVAKNPKSAELAGRLAEYLRGQGRLDQALEVLTQASDPRAAGDRGSLRVQRALVLTSLGQGREARTSLLQNINQLPPAERDEVWTYLFLLCKSQGDPETTRAVYNEWIRLLPEDPRPKFALLEMEIDANDQRAIHERLKSLAPHNDQGEFIYRLVQARQRLVEAKKAPTEKDRKDLLKDANDLVESVLHDFKIDTVALLLKGQILEAEGTVEKAADFYNQAWSRGNVDALIRLIELWTRLGRKPELDRLRQNDKTRQLDQIVAMTYLNYGTKGGGGNAALSEAARIARQSLAENQAGPSWQVGLLDFLGKNEEAETRLRMLTEQQPDKLESWLALIRFLVSHRRPQAAADRDRRIKTEATLEEIEPLLKGQWPDELLAAEFRFAAADWPAADRAFDAALKRYPQLPEVRAAEANYRAHKEDLAAAEACLSHLKAEANIAKFKPLLKAGWSNDLLVAECRFAAADWPAAKTAFDAALKRYPQLPQVQAAEARYRAQKERPEAAEACLKRLEAEAAIAAEVKPHLKNRWPDELLAAECRFAAADWPAADRAFDAALKRHPEVPEVQAAAKRYQAQKGRPDASEACLRRLKVEAAIVEAKQRVKLPWPEFIEAECRRAAGDGAGAEHAFDTAANRYPDARDVQSAAARYYEETGRLEMAEVCLRRLLARNPDERGAARELALVLSSQGDRPGAWKEALELLGPESPKTNTPEERLARAIVLGRGRDLPRMKQAIGILQALMADIPADSALATTAREMLTRFLLAAGQTDQASRVAAYASAKGRNPAAIALHAEALLQSRQFDAAEEQIKRLEQIDPENAAIASFRARLIRGRSKPAEAAAALEKHYVDLAKENNAHAEQFGREAFPMILALGPDAQNAQEVAEQLASRLDKQNPRLSWMRASILAKQGKRAEALALCRTAAEAGISLTDFYDICRITMEVVAASRTETTALQQAGEILEAALRRFPEAEDLLVMKAMINHFQSRFDEELRVYRMVLSRRPRLPVALNNIAWVLSEGLHQPSEALEKIDEMIQLTGRNPNNVDTRGVILVRLGRLDQAIEELKWVVQAEPTGVHYFHLAQAYRKKGQDADFRKAFEEAKRAGLTPVALDPTERADFEDLLKL